MSKRSSPRRRRDAFGVAPTKARTKANSRPKSRRPQLEALEPRWVLAAPTLAAIPDVTVLAGAPLNIALDGFDADNDQLSFGATSTNPGLTLGVPTGNHSLRLDVANFGTMEFQLYDDLAPKTAFRIEELANQGFYNGVIFHRVIKDFVIQTGDPTGTGSGGSGFKFDDEFNALLQHTSAGVLSMAKTTDDTNDSQFFITANGNSRHLDFQHSIFGFQTSGESVRQAIENVPVNGTKPVNDVVISSATVFFDRENGVLRLIAPENFTGDSDVTVTVSDGNGGTAQRTFHVHVAPDTVNNNPFLGPVPPTVTTSAGASVTVPITATDVEGDQVEFAAAAQNDNVTVSLNPTVANSTGQTSHTTLSIVPKAGFTGTVDVFVAVGAVGQLTDDTVVDVQKLRVTVGPAGVTVDLVSDTGPSDTDNVTKFNNTPGKELQFNVTGLTSGATVKLFDGATLIGQGTAAGTSAVITTNGTATLADGTHNITAIQTVNGQDSPPSTALAIAIDTKTPIFTAVASDSQINAGETYTFDFNSDEEGQPGVSYSIPAAPDGAIIDAQTGAIRWVPNASQSGQQFFRTLVSDLAGNVAEHTFQVNVLNSAPVLEPIANQFVKEHSTLTVQAVASDTNLPADKITYSIDPTDLRGVAINAQTGVLTWTPSESDGPGDYVLSIRATDAGGKSDVASFNVHVDEVNEPPVFVPIPDALVNQGSKLVLVLTANDPDVPATPVKYKLVSGPLGASINPDTGFFTYTPTANQGPNEVPQGRYTVTVQAIDSTGLTDTKSFVVTVNVAPNIVEPGDATVAEETTFDRQIIVDDPNVTYNATDERTGLRSFTPADHLRFFLLAGPKSASIDIHTGELRWTPSEQDGPGTYKIVIGVEDAGALTDTTEFNVVVTEVNRSPVINPVDDQSAIIGSPLKVQIVATDPDVPANALTYSLEPGSPAGAAIDRVTGLLTFTPQANTPGRVSITVRVTDNGAGNLSSTMTFNIDVQSLIDLTFSETSDIPGLLHVGPIVPSAIGSQPSEPQATPTSLTQLLPSGAQNFSMFVDTGVPHLSELLELQNQNETDPRKEELPTPGVVQNQNAADQNLADAVSKNAASNNVESSEARQAAFAAAMDDDGAEAPAGRAAPVHKASMRMDAKAKTSPEVEDALNDLQAETVNTPASDALPVVDASQAKLAPTKRGPAPNTAKPAAKGGAAVDKHHRSSAAMAIVALAPLVAPGIRRANQKERRKQDGKARRARFERLDR